MQFDNAQTVFTKVLKLGSVLIASIAVVGAGLSFIFAGESGFFGALIGAGIALVFVSFTALSVLIGGKLSLGGFYAVVLGGWLLKIILFIGLLVVLRDVEGLNRVALFITLVASVLGSLAVDAYVATKARIPAVS
jgi:hypothetical protein